MKVLQLSKNISFLFVLCAELFQFASVPCVTYAHNPNPNNDDRGSDGASLSEEARYHSLGSYNIYPPCIMGFRLLEFSLLDYQVINNAEKNSNQINLMGVNL